MRPEESIDDILMSFEKNKDTEDKDKNSRSILDELDEILIYSDSISKDNQSNNCTNYFGTNNDTKSVTDNNTKSIIDGKDKVIKYTDKYDLIINPEDLNDVFIGIYFHPSEKERKNDIKKQVDVVRRYCRGYSEYENPFYNITCGDYNYFEDYMFDIYGSGTNNDAIKAVLSDNYTEKQVSKVWYTYLYCYAHYEDEDYMYLPGNLLLTESDPRYEALMKDDTVDGNLGENNYYDDNIYPSDEELKHIMDDYIYDLITWCKWGELGYHIRINCTFANKDDLIAVLSGKYTMEQFNKVYLSYMEDCWGKRIKLDCENPKYSDLVSKPIEDTDYMITDEEDKVSLITVACRWHGLEDFISKNDKSFASKKAIKDIIFDNYTEEQLERIWRLCLMQKKSQK